MPTTTRFKGIADMRNSLFTQSLADNLIDFFNWAFLEAEGFTDVPVNDPGQADEYADERLFPVHLQSVADGTIWQATNTDWVYETGLEVLSQPIVASGVYVNGTFYPTSTTTGQYSHYINYPAGQIVFNTAIPTTSFVQAAYSWRWISLYDHDVPWFKDVVFDALLLDQQAKFESTDAVIALLEQFRVQPPLVIIEPVMTRRLQGYQLGSGAQTIFQDVLFHIIAERSDERNNLMDIITFQKDKTIVLYDVNERRRDNEFSLDWRGMRIDGAKMYPELIEYAPNGYALHRCRFSKMVGEEVTLKLPLFRAIVRATIEIDLAEM